MVSVLDKVPIGVAHGRQEGIFQGLLRRTFCVSRPRLRYLTQNLDKTTTSVESRDNVQNIKKNLIYIGSYSKQEECLLFNGCST